MRHITDGIIDCAANAAALGNFDGLHLGHQRLIRAAAKAGGGSAAVFSFFPHPAGVLAGAAFKTIMTSEEKAALLGGMGIDVFIEYPFDKKVSAMPPEEFVSGLLCGRLNVKTVVIGEGYRFGQGGKGDAALLTSMGGGLGFSVKIIPHVTDGGGKISSTRVREAVSRKEFAAAEALMGRPYFIMGEVVHGNRIGRAMGLPTANVKPPAQKLLPPPGVYATKVEVSGAAYAGKTYRGMTNIGTRPTIGDSAGIIAETNILGFDGDIYGHTLTVSFGRWIRPEMKFGGLDELRGQIMKDIKVTLST